MPQQAVTLRAVCCDWTGSSGGLLSIGTVRLSIHKQTDCRNLCDQGSGSSREGIRVGFSVRYLRFGHPSLPCPSLACPAQRWSCQERRDTGKEELHTQTMGKPLEHQERQAAKPRRLLFLNVCFILSYVKLTSSTWEGKQS